MALVQQEPMNKLVDELIEGAEDEEIGFFTSYYRVIKRLALGGLVKGFMNGIGAFIGSLFCHYYILPLMDLQFYSLYMIKLYGIK